jgi:hypothetical protein
LVQQQCRILTKKAYWEEGTALLFDLREMKRKKSRGKIHINEIMKHAYRNQVRMTIRGINPCSFNKKWEWPHGHMGKRWNHGLHRIRQGCRGYWPKSKTPSGKQCIKNHKQLMCVYIFFSKSKNSQ